jgi:biopolymer transport protein TolR
MGSKHNSSDSSVTGLSGQPMLSEINVTPFVDVMLVLLIIFMVSAPLMQQGIQVDLPKTKSPALSDQDKPIILVIKRSSAVEIGGTEISVNQLQEKLKAIYAKREKKEIYVQADKAIPYGTVTNIMSQIQASGVTRIGLVTEPKDKY